MYPRSCLDDHHPAVIIRAVTLRRIEEVSLESLRTGRSISIPFTDPTLDLLSCSRGELGNCS